ncbi:riboflavin synthase [Candidatus Peregrinibacteria bacterium]|nr:riboflavin synthase [Candidatus Peregrinibacteria bacterium]
MFTGIIEATAKVIKNEHGRLTIERPKIFDDIKVGSSICIAGVCLTIVDLKEKTMGFDTVPETLKRTTLGEKQAGDLVNLERALKADGRFEGHVVQGHSEAVGEILSLSKDGMLRMVYPNNLKKFIVEKGSIAIDGVSLTVARLKGNECTIALIPHTLKVTTLGLLKEGDRVNIETDILGRYIRKCS